MISITTKKSNTATVFLMSLSLALVAQNAWAGTYTERATYDPDPQIHGDEVTVTFTATSNNNEQAKADVKKLREEFEKRFNNSDDMKKKVKEAGGKNGKALTISANRDDSRITAGQRQGGTGNVYIDPGDIEKMGPYMSGKAQDIKAVMGYWAGSLIAHEIDHARDGQNGTAHRDPPGAGPKASAKTGKPVDDENQVQEDMVAAKQTTDNVKRNEYGYSARVAETDKNGNTRQVSHSFVSWTVNGQVVTLDVTLYARALRTATTTGAAQQKAVDPQVIIDVPEGPCSTGVPECWQSAGEGDVDMDGVPDGVDNCPTIANPRQGDYDGDGMGTECDPDDDNDGLAGTLETAMGSSDTDPSATPEHWSMSGTCQDGVDNDLDGLVDSADPGCEPIPPNSTLWPGLLEPGALYPIGLRTDLGGVREGASIATGTLELMVDFNLDGTPDEVLMLQGSVVIGHGHKMATYGQPDYMDTAILAMQLTGHSPGLGGIVLAEASDQAASPGKIVKPNPPPPPPREFPVESFFDVFFKLSVSPGSNLSNMEPLHIEGMVNQWPFLGEMLMKPSGPPVGLYNSMGTHVANILNAAFHLPPYQPPIRLDSDGDGDVDHDDFAALQLCYTGSGDPDGTFDYAVCDRFDGDQDSDIDDLDVGELVYCASGPELPADPMCGAMPCDSLVNPTVVQTTSAIQGRSASPGAIAYRISNKGTMSHMYGVMEVDAVGMPMNYPWLSLSKEETTISAGWSDTVIANVDASILTSGVHNAYIKFSDDCGSLVDAIRTIQLTVTPPPECGSTVSPVQMQTSSAVLGEPADPGSIMYTIANDSAMMHVYNIEEVDAVGMPFDHPFLNLGTHFKLVEPFDSGWVFADLNTDGLLPGVYTAFVKITDDCTPPTSEVRAIQLNVSIP